MKYQKFSSKGVGRSVARVEGPGRAGVVESLESRLLWSASPVPLAGPDDGVASVLEGTTQAVSEVAVLQGRVFFDADRDGVFDETEAPSAGYVTFLDADEDGTLDEGESSAETGADGGYSFEVAPGMHRVTIVPPPGVGVTNAIGSYERFVEGPGTVDGLDFAVAGRWSIGGIVFNDADRDGILDPEEVELEGRQVYLDLNGSGAFDLGEPSRRTDDTGSFEFLGLMPGSYHVRQTLPASWEQSFPAPNAGWDVTLEGPRADVLFGAYRIPDASISGVLWDDADGDGFKDPGEPPAVATVYLDLNQNGVLDGSEPSVVTSVAGNGAYRFGDLPAGTYRVVTVFPGQWGSTTHSTETVTLADGEQYARPALGAARLGSISGTLREDVQGTGKKGTAPLVSWQVFLDVDGDGVLDRGEPGVLTDVNGNYRFDGLLPGVYVVRMAAKAGWRTTAPVGGVGTQVTGSTARKDFLATRAAQIGGVVYDDVNGNGRRDPGEPALTRTVFLDLDEDGVRDGNEPRFRSSPVQGASFPGLSAGTYRARFLPVKGWHSTTPGALTLKVGQGQVAKFAFGTSNRATIKGSLFRDANGDSVRQKRETAIPDQKLFLDLNANRKLDSGEPTTQADRNGKWVFAGVTPGTVTVRPVKLRQHTLSPGSVPKLTFNVDPGRVIADVELGLKPIA